MEMSSRRQLAQAPICGRVEKPLLPMKKRATSDSSSSGLSSADDSFEIPPKKRRVESWSDGGSAAYGTSLQTYQYEHDTVMVCARAASLKPASSNAITAVTFQLLQQKKLTHNHNAILSGGERSDHRLLLHAVPRHGLAACNGGMESRDVWGRGSTREEDDEQEQRQGATAGWRHEPRDTYFVHDHKPGLRVSAIDGRGMEFEVKLRYLYSNFAYRLIGEWGRFVTEHNLRDVFNKGRRVEDSRWSSGRSGRSGCWKTMTSGR
ncbi:hypothetical protein ACQ4PT_060324 [Festuca glaucescens]